jgi:hypothetical protein|tara:strand:- start:832 stop:939 length:108 start_codon:yes stop_codon:yes gene_type:complete
MSSEYYYDLGEIRKVLEKILAELQSINQKLDKGQS